MATGSAQFRTAAEWGSTNAFTFSTTNSSLNSYVTSTTQIPTKATLKGALKTGYTMTITNDSTYLSNQLVPNSAITVTQAATDPILDVRNCYFATGNGTLALSATTLYNYAGASMRNANFSNRSLSLFLDKTKTSLIDSVSKSYKRSNHPFNIRPSTFVCVS
jgi:hypothetical protein